MISFREHCQLAEAFTNPLPIDAIGYPGTWRAKFTVPAIVGRTGITVSKEMKYEIEFNQRAYGPYKNTGLTIPKELKTSNIAWEFTFGNLTTASGSVTLTMPDYELTGSGQAFRVFATVIHALKMFVRSEGRPFIFFTAKEASRQKLYDRFVRLVAAAVPGMHGFKMKDTRASREILGSRGGGGTYVIVPRHISQKIVVDLVEVWHTKTAKAAHEFLSGL